jgi:methyl-accepting chemotaxis protein
MEDKGIECPRGTRPAREKIMLNSIKARFIAGSVAILMSVGLLAGLSIWVEDVLAGDLTDSAEAAEAMRDHIESDMMHDTLRGDVTFILLQSLRGESDMAEARAALDGHAAEFQRLIAANQARSLPPDIDRALGGVREPLNAYIAAAKAEADLAQRDPEAALAGLAEFDRKFAALEEPMGEVSDLITAHFQSLHDSSAKTIEFASWAMLAMAIAAGSICLAAAVFGVTSIVNPLGRISESIRALLEGNLSTQIPYRNRKDEIGQLAGALEVFRNSLGETERLRAEAETRKAEAETERRESMRRLAEEFERAAGVAVAKVAVSADGMRGYAERLSNVANQANQRASGVAAASEQAAVNVSTVASATEELSSSIGEITRQVAESAKAASGAVEEARRADNTMDQLAGAADKIGAVIKLISDIADQTNLLALNATIEAARAGESGKGFAVVAGEVKALASQTAKATDEIGQQIANMQSVTQNAVTAIRSISKSITRIDGIGAAIAAAVEQQGAATGEISRNIQEAASGTKNVSEGITVVSRIAGETGDVSREVLDASSGLSEQAQRLKREVENFISTVRRA